MILFFDNIVIKRIIINRNRFVYSKRNKIKKFCKKKIQNNKQIKFKYFCFVKVINYHLGHKYINFSYIKETYKTAH